MPFDPTIALIRFGTGLSPRHGLPGGVQGLLDDVSGPDMAARRIPIPAFKDARPNLRDIGQVNRALRAAEGPDLRDVALENRRTVRKTANALRDRNFLATIGRATDAETGMRERLTWFWADHFTVMARNGDRRHLVTPFVEEAIRPQVGGRFVDMLRAVVTHPMMLMYLQQVQSFGPNSVLGKRNGRGINENLARELLELHSIGVDGPYTQTDVRELAELLTGLTYHVERGFSFQDRRAEPGTETVMGISYGGPERLENILQAVEDLAAHPSTARHIAQKLARYFVADVPDPALVAVMTEAYVAHDGALMPVYEAMLAHPMAWLARAQKVKAPLDFIASALRALGISGAGIMEISTRDFRQQIDKPMRVMGQPWEQPVGPDGWPDTAAQWIIPQAMAGRISWAMQAPQKLVDDLPDPRDFVLTALGQSAPADVIFAATAAEIRAEGIGVVLASAAFQRR